MANDPSTNEPSTQPQGGQASSSPAQGAPPTATHGDASKTHEELEHLNAELMRDNAKYRKVAREREEAERIATELRLKEQGEFKALAEQHEARVKELEPTVERYSKLAELVHEQIKATTKEWPDEVKSLVPGKDIPVEERLAAVEKLKPLVEKLTTHARLPGNSPGPTPAGGESPQSVETYTKRLLGTGKYSF